ncbi:MAG: AAA family ATPase [Gracilimonas sp.]|uniref:ATP-dependent nuclease n=1 Tax=Gracilimonas sp. TaxID=1974203 RepID=UPI001B054392|nr:AAA family ATPase [Gracilimonas sp.]MBO6584761.1 AAA family ATPase [Gracilimonas sp.]MBO6615968.1 AAA family ATPase [Gracilimonas sp.]
MWLRDLSIKNFRKIESLNVTFQKGLSILVGENNSGKTAIIDALRLILFPSRDYDSLKISEDDFRYGTDFKPIEISCRFTDLSEIDEVHFSECLVDIGDGKFEIQINLRIEFSTISNRPNFKMWGGETEGGSLPSNHYDRLETVYLQPLRDPEKGLRPSQYSQIARLLSTITSEDKEADYEEIVKTANQAIRSLDQVESAVGSINNKLKEITGDELSQKTDLIFNDPNFRRIIAGLQPEIDNLPFSLNGLGYNNLIFTATTLATLSSGDQFSHKSILIEEPEAHLHPQLQVLLLRHLAKVTEKDEIDVQVIASTHSPILASQAPIDSVISVSDIDGIVSTICVNKIKIEDKTKKKLQRYLDATRGELFFARRILMVEGISEALLLPILTQFAGGDLKESAITVINTQGINFDAFLSLFVQNEKNMPIAILTDGDADEIGGDISATAKGLKEKEEVVHNLSVELPIITFEHELARSEVMLSHLINAFKEVHPQLGVTLEQELNSINGIDQKANRFLEVFKEKKVSKGKFAQELAYILGKTELGPEFVPEYIKKALRHLGVIKNEVNDAQPS